MKEIKYVNPRSYNDFSFTLHILYLEMHDKVLKEKSPTANPFIHIFYITWIG